MLPDKLAWLHFWIFTVACTLDGSVNSSNWFVNANDPTDDEIPSEVTAKIGDDLIIECTLPDYKLTFFAWKFCQSDCRSPTADWEMVVKVDYGKIQIFNQTKFTLDPNGSLILKDIQPSNNHNWVRCFHKEQFVGQDHRSTIISVAQEPPVINTSDNPKEYVVIEKMPFVVFCEVRGYPPPWVAWIWKGQVLQNITNRPKYLVRHHATTEEAGNYTCMAGNFAGVTSYNFLVTVRVERPTAESMPSSVAPSAGTTRKADGKSISLGDGLAIAFCIFIAVVVTIYCVKRRRERKEE